MYIIIIGLGLMVIFKRPPRVICGFLTKAKNRDNTVGQLARSDLKRVGIIRIKLKSHFYSSYKAEISNEFSSARF